eukprot:NODE_8983_length_1454_cov_13.333082.p1 GENE.NODE_8983_length_1454_cov_13.333082~~NODE_8983_length_1454_cov_13.333082.p1  ORF type:complete len:362 (+),score=38.77 NODE_8983_length_1454_cov_13.333082:130-1215(+)
MDDMGTLRNRAGPYGVCEGGRAKEVAAAEAEASVQDQRANSAKEVTATTSTWRLLCVALFAVVLVVLVSVQAMIVTTLLTMGPWMALLAAVGASWVLVAFFVIGFYVPCISRALTLTFSPSIYEMKCAGNHGKGAQDELWGDFEHVKGVVPASSFESYQDWRTKMTSKQRYKVDRAKREVSGRSQSLNPRLMRVFDLPRIIYIITIFVWRTRPLAWAHGGSCVVGYMRCLVTAVSWHVYVGEALVGLWHNMLGNPALYGWNEDGKLAAFTVSTLSQSGTKRRVLNLKVEMCTTRSDYWWFICIDHAIQQAFSNGCDTFEMPATLKMQEKVRSFGLEIRREPYEKANLFDFTGHEGVLPVEQ